MLEFIPELVKFEYQVVSLSYVNSSVLNNYGKQGWELASLRENVTSQNSWSGPNISYECVFKRKLILPKVSEDEIVDYLKVELEKLSK